MIENIFENTAMGSNTVILSVPEEDYFISYEAVTKEAAQEISKNFFLMRGREGIPDVRDVEFDEPSHRIKITLSVRENKEHNSRGYVVPDSLNITRNHEAD